MLKQNFNRQDFEVLLNQYSISLTTLETWGVRIGDQSRLRSLVADLEFLAAGRIPKEVRDVAYLAHSVLEADEVVDIVAALTESDLDAEVREKLKLLHKDPYVKQQAINAPGRSSQFELYVRALLKRGGLAVQMSTPDLKVSSGDGTTLLNLEAKRPLGPNNLEGNIRKALSQIDGATPGSIVIGLDHLIFGDKDVVVLEEGDTFQSGSEHLIYTVSDWVSDQRPLIERCIAEKGVPIAGILMLAKLPIVTHQSPFMGFAFHFTAIRIAPVGSPQREAFERVEATLEKVWGNPS